MTTASEICEALRGVFPSPEWLLGFEVRNAAGFDANRAIDAQAINTWPSRGMEIVAIEIKVSRGDLARELAAPQKIEEGAAYADRIAIAAPKGLIKPAELPKGWGLIEVNGDGKGRWKDKGERKPAKPIDRAALVTMARSLTGDIEAEIRRRMRVAEDKRSADFEKRIAREVERRQKTRDELARRRQPIDDWLKECGFEDWCSNDAIKAAVQIAHKANLGGSDYGHGLPATHKTLERITKELGDALREIGAIEP